MTNNTTVCDLCTASSPVADKHANGFVTLNVQFAGPTKLKPLMNGSDNFVDFCKDCFDAFIGFATDRRAKSQLPTEPPVAAPTPPPALQPGVHVVLNELPSAPLTVAEPHAEPAAEHASEPTPEHHA